MYWKNGWMGSWGFFLLIDAGKLHFGCIPKVLVASFLLHPQMLQSHLPWGCKDMGGSQLFELNFGPQYPLQ